MKYKWTDPTRVKSFINLLNEVYGWELVGGHKSKEFFISSTVNARGKFYFDGFDNKRLIFFEFDDLSHTYSPDIRQRDKIKTEALQKVVQSCNRKGMLIRFDEVKNSLKVIDL